MAFFRKKAKKRNSDNLQLSKKEQQLVALKFAVAFLEQQKSQLLNVTGSAPIVEMKKSAAACAATCAELLLACVETYSALLPPRLGSLADVYQRRIDENIDTLLHGLPKCDLHFLRLEKEILPLIQTLAQNIDACSKAF